MYHYACVHFPDMNMPRVSEVPALLRAIMEKQGLTQSLLAARLSVDQPQISRWLAGSKPNGANFEAILTLARNMSVIDDMRSEDVANILSSPAPARTVKLKGYVGASGEAFYYRLADEDLEEVPAVEGATEQTVAVEVRGKSLGPALESWLVYYDDVRSPITADMLNQLCVVGLADDRLLVKRLERKNGQVVLVSNNGDPDITDAIIEWAAKVTAMKPR